jgi:hypothetical protein
MSLLPNLLPSNPVHCGTTAERCLFLYTRRVLLFSLTHPARAGQQLEWTVIGQGSPAGFNCVPSDTGPTGKLPRHQVFPPP